MGCCDFYLIFDACRFMGNMCVSSYRSCVLMYVVHPVVIQSAVFYVICSLLVFVSDAIGDHMEKRTRVWVLLWLCMLRGSFHFVPMLLMRESKTRQSA